jgi:hypothetical protein
MLHQFPEHLYHLNQTIHFPFFESLCDEARAATHLTSLWLALTCSATTRSHHDDFAVTGWKPLALMGDEAATHHYHSSYVEHVLCGWSTD